MVLAISSSGVGLPHQWCEAIAHK